MKKPRSLLSRNGQGHVDQPKQPGHAHGAAGRRLGGPSVTATSQHRLGASRVAAAAYLRSRQSPGGGFCGYRSELLDEPNPFDTWHAVASLGLLGEAVPQAGACARFVAAQLVDGQVHALYYRVRSLHTLGSPDPQGPAVRAAVADLVVQRPDPCMSPSELGGALQSLRHAVWLKQHFGCAHRCADIVETLLRLEDTGGGFAVPPDLVTTEAVCAVLRLCGHAVPASTADYVDSLALVEFGFRLTATSLSPNLETLCAGIRCCSVSGRAMVHRADAERFILACQGGRGGFARAPGALPDIACTHLALEGLELLHQPSGPRATA